MRMLNAILKKQMEKKKIFNNGGMKRFFTIITTATLCFVAVFA